MRFIRRLTLLAVVTAGAAVLAGPALAAPRPGGYPFTLDSAHFRIHYLSATGQAAAITQTTAGDVATVAERVYNAELGDGFPAPLSDGVLGGDGRIDIYVVDPGSLSGALGAAAPDGAGSPSSGFIVVGQGSALDRHTLAHELFHLIQYGIWVPTKQVDDWLLEVSAEWMGYRVNGYDDSTHPFDFGPSDMALDCADPLGTNMCSFDDYENLGYSRWTFFEYLAEKYGATFVTDVLAQGAAADSALPAIANALAAKGTSLSDTYNAWIAADMSGGYSAAALKTLRPQPIATVQTGVVDGPVDVANVDVNHLSTRYVKFLRGDGDASHICFVATLDLSVTVPAGMASVPTFYWDDKGSSPVQLALNGGVASASFPWDTCTHPSNAGYLAISNASYGAGKIDAADFAVSAYLHVTTQQTTPAPPPEQVKTTTPVVPVSSSDVAPALSLFGPEVLKLSATETQLRLIVQSSGQGTVKARLGSKVLGAVAVRGGNNDVRFKLPGGTLQTLRRSAATSNVLTLTPVSADGSSTGASVTRIVRVSAPKAKQRAKLEVKRRK
jgi:hypothetical protein